MANTIRTRLHTNYLIIHSSATKKSWWGDIDDIRLWHLARGFSDVGYQFVITRDGAIQHGRERDAVGAHSKGKNSESIGICMIGGVANDGKTAEFNFTRPQLAALEDLLTDLSAIYYEARIVGHRDVMPPGYTECPSFDVASWWNEG